MAEYIDRETVIRTVRKYLTVSGDDNLHFSDYSERINSFIRDVISEIEYIPAVDARPEMYGRWVIDEELSNGYRICKCSVCGRGWSTKAALPEFVNDGGHFYCGSCGAKMDGKEKTDDS